MWNIRKEESIRISETIKRGGKIKKIVIRGIQSETISLGTLSERKGNSRDGKR